MNNTNWKYCTLETAKRLRELGLKQTVNPGDSYHVKLSNGKWKQFIQSEDEDNVSTVPFEWYKAPDLSEAMRVLDIIGHVCILGKILTYSNIEKNRLHTERYDNKTIFPAEAACRMIVWLAENGLMDLKGVKI